MERPDATTLRRIAALIGVLGGLTYMVLVWLVSNDIRNELLVPRAEVLREVDVVTVGGGRVGLSRTPVSTQEGVWGIRGPEGTFGIVGDIVELRTDVVVRTLDVVEGVFSIGDVVSWDPKVYRGDPATALGIDFEPIRIPGELGVAPAWFIDGRQDTWVIIVHDRDAGLDESLRLLPALVDADYPVVVTTYRGDGMAPRTDSGRWAWGVDEWPEVEDAVRWSQGQGAQDIAIVGLGMGASIVAQFLHETTLLSSVRGVVFDSPVLDLEATSDAISAADGIPGVLSAPARAIARLRFKIEWSVLDQVDRASEYDVPLLVFQGTADTVAPIGVAEAFEAGVPEGLMTLDVVEGAGHGTVWNTDPAAYELALLEFLAVVSSPA